MQKRLIYVLYYFLFWIVFFQLARIIFVLYQFENLLKIDLITFLKIFTYGLKMDLSFAGYLSVIPLIILIISLFIPQISRVLLKIYSYLIIFFSSLLFVLDLELFRVWGYKLDDSILKYLHSPTEMIASSLASPIYLLMGLFLFYFVAFLFIYTKFIHKKLEKLKTESAWKASVFFVLLAFLIIPIRGGFGLSPMNQSTVCFSSNNFANQAAINYAWNFLDTVLYEQEDSNPYIFMDISKADSLSKEMYIQEKPTVRVLKNKKPNIVLIIWESFTYKVLAEKDIVPEFNSLKKEGIFFDNIYANGDRSDKGLVALFSAYPTIPGRSIINIFSKTSKLPQLSKTLAKENYETAFFYGGELEFFRLKSYLSTGDYSFVVSKNDFSKDEMNSKWGAHDHIVYEKLEEKLKQAKEPVFYSMFTLSSHEPFEIPTEPLLKENDEESKFLNSMHYADKSLGDFISNMKKSPIWDNTLFIIVADHGHRMPHNSKYYSPEAFHIPILWLGGALNVSDTIINTYGNQTDLATTLMSQMSINSDEYRWSRNLFSNDKKDFAYYAFSYGFGFVNNSSTIVYDAQASKYLIEIGKQLDTYKMLGKAILQTSYQDYFDK